MEFTSFETRLSILRSILVLTEANFIDRNCSQREREREKESIT